MPDLGYQQLGGNNRSCTDYFDLTSRRYCVTIYAVAAVTNLFL